MEGVDLVAKVDARGHVQPREHRVVGIELNDALIQVFRVGEQEAECEFQFVRNGKTNPRRM